MRNGFLVIVAAVLCLTAVLPAQTSQTKQATTAPADAEDTAALKQKIKELERRLEAVEAASSDAHIRQIEREELVKLIKEMKLDIDKHTDMRLFWREGVRMESGDGAFKIHLGGRLQTDWTWFRGADFNSKHPLGNKEPKDGAELRRVYLTLDGQIYDNVEFCIQYDFVGQTKVEDDKGNAAQIGAPKPVDVYVRLTKIPCIGDITAGHFNEPFSMEQITSDANQVFMERSLGNALVPARNVGFQAHNAFIEDSAKVKRMTYAVGMFRDTDDFGFQQADGGYEGTGRITGLPLYADGGRQLIHLGGAYSYREPPTQVQFRSRPEDHMAPYLVDTGKFTSDPLQLFGAEAAGVYGPAHVEGEFMAAKTNASRGDGVLTAFYTEGGYFFTGESKPYNTALGCWDRVRPKKNYREDGGWGALELAARYSFIDLNSSGLEGGQMQDITLGLNWYLNPNVRVMLNYIHSWQNTWGTSSDAFMMRFQVDF
ncbi:MAG: OprO/OprP family phosphate-selective porin [Phycisphaerae bacterium]